MEALVAPVTLIVKSCNQQFEDQVISCETDWTIRKLKQQLAEVYPTKPKTEEQKLIYSGQLLHDGIVLKDILRQYEGQNTHTVHLVFTPKQMKEEKIQPTAKSQEPKVSSINQSTTTTTTTTTPVIDSNSASDGIRQRNVAHTVQANPLTQIPNNPFLNPNLFYNPFQSGFVPQNAPVAAPAQPGDYLASQQVAMQAWMQQAYVQYVNQYMNMLQVGAQSTPMYAPATAANPPNFAYFPAVNTQAAAAPAPAAPQPVAEPAAQPVQRRFPNIVVDDPQENRDWLDISYFMLRITIVLAIIYIYSSPIRCLTVFSIGIILYLYRRGVFRNQIIDRNLNPNRNNINNNNNNNNNNNEVAQPQVDGNAVVDGAGVDAAAAATGTTAGTPQEQNRTTMLVTIRTFILSFIFSLIPETPAL